MSLVNDMLRDLEDRSTQAAQKEPVALPNAVGNNKDKRTFLAIFSLIAFLLSVGLLAGYFYQQAFFSKDLSNKEAPAAKVPAEIPPQHEPEYLAAVNPEPSPQVDFIEEPIEAKAQQEGTKYQQQKVVEPVFNSESQSESQQISPTKPASVISEKPVVQDKRARAAVKPLSEQSVESESAAKIDKPKPKKKAVSKSTEANKWRNAALAELQKMQLDGGPVAGKAVAKKTSKPAITNNKSKPGRGVEKKKSSRVNRPVADNDLKRSAPVKAVKQQEKVKIKRVKNFDDSFAVAKRAWAINDMAKAEIALRDSLAANKRHLQSRLMLATLLLNAKRFQQSHQITMSSPTDQLRNNDIALIHARALDGMGKSREALGFLQNFSNSVGKPSLDIMRLQAALMQRMGRNEEAALIYSGIIRSYPADAQSWAGLGIAQDAAGYSNKAVMSYKRALKTGNLSLPLVQYLQDRIQLLTKGG